MLAVRMLESKGNADKRPMEREEVRTNAQIMLHFQSMVLKKKNPVTSEVKSVKPIIMKSLSIQSPVYHRGSLI